MEANNVSYLPNNDQPYRTLCIVLFVVLATLPKSTVTVGASSVAMKDYTMIHENGIWNVTQGSLNVRSLLECLTQCSKIENVCGFNYIRTTGSNSASGKTCHCVEQSDLVQHGRHSSMEGALFYVRETCKSQYQTIVSPPTATADAMFCTENTTYVFNGDMVAVYGSYETLTEGSNVTYTLSSRFPGSSSPVNAAFLNDSHIYLEMDGYVSKYTSDSFTLISRQSTATLFGTGSDDSDDSDESYGSTLTYDAMLQSGNRTYLFQGTTLTMVEKGVVAGTVSFDANSVSNPYKSVGLNGRPQSIVAGCSIDADRHVFISEGKVYLFTFSTQCWTILGNFVWD